MIALRKIFIQIFYLLHLHILVEMFMVIYVYYLSWRRRHISVVIGQKVCIVGTGPSLDVDFIERQEDTTFIFLNAAVQLKKFVKPSCRAIWLTSDSRALFLYHPLRPSDIKLVCVVSDLFRFHLISKLLLKNDKLYLPFLTIDREWWNVKKSSKIRIIPSYLKEPVLRLKRSNLKSNTRFQLYSGTVSANALMYCLDAGVSEVYLTGVDLLNNPEHFSRHSVELRTHNDVDMLQRINAAQHARKVLSAVKDHLENQGVKVFVHSYLGKSN